MQEYTVKFYKGGILVCICTKLAVSAEEAMINAEYALLCKYPNVEYDHVEA